MNSKPQKAFILAAGKGTRLRPYTDTIPKPMVEITGTSIIRRTIQKLKDAGVKEVVVNAHHHADLLIEHLSNISNPHIIISREDTLLETGGGIKKALHHFGHEPFYIINGDALWIDGEEPVFEKLARVWNPDNMDILLFLLPKDKAHLSAFVGDYHLHQNGRATRARDKNGDHMFAGIRIAKPSIFGGSPDGAFSFLTLMDKAEESGRLYGMAHGSSWYHISTPEDLESVNQEFHKKGL